MSKISCTRRSHQYVASYSPFVSYFERCGCTFSPSFLGLLRAYLHALPFLPHPWIFEISYCKCRPSASPLRLLGPILYNRKKGAGSNYKVSCWRNWSELKGVGKNTKQLEGTRRWNFKLKRTRPKTRWCQHGLQAEGKEPQTPYLPRAITCRGNCPRSTYCDYF